MKKVSCCFLCGVFILLSISLSGFVEATQAQQTNANAEHNPVIDSLLHVLKTTIEDTTRVNTLNSLSRQYSNISSTELAMQYAQQALQHSEKLQYKKGIANAYNNTGIVYWNKGTFEKALDNFLKSLKIKLETGDKQGIANSYNNIGLVYWNQGNYEMALNNLLKSLTIWEEIGDKNGLGMAYLNIGNIYMNQSIYDKALEFYFKSLKIITETRNKNFEATNLNNIGIVYQYQNNLVKALDYQLKALKIREEINDKKGVAMSYNNIGLVYFEQGDYEKALESQLKSQKINMAIGNKQGVAVSYTNIGNIYIKQKKFEDAFHYNMLSLNLSKTIGFKVGVKDAYFSLSDLFEKKGDYKQAYNYQKLYSDMKDTLLNEQSSKQITEMNTKYGSEKKDKEIQLLNKDKEKQALLAAAESRRQHLILFSVSVFLLMVIVFALFIYRSFRQKKRLNLELEKLSIVASETDNGVLICGPHGEIEWSNPGLTRLLGYTFGEMKEKGNTIEELSSNPNIKQVIHQSIENKKSSTYEVLNTTKDGKERWTQSTLTPILDEVGNIKKLVVIDTDISDRKKIEEKLNLQNLELEQSQKDISILSDIGMEITSSLSVEKIIEKTYENVNRLMEASVFFIGIYDEENNQLFFPGAMERGVKFPAVFYDLSDNSRPAVWCFKNQKEIIMNDLRQEYSLYFPNTPVPNPVAGETPESLVYIPLTIQGKRIGVISVQSFNKNAYNSYHISIVRNLAVYVTIAIENAQLYENLEAKVEERTAELVRKKEEIEKTYNNIQILSEIGQEITSTLNLETVLDTVYKKVNALMDATEFGIGIYNQEKLSIDFSYYYYESKRMEGDLDTWVSMNDKNRLSVWCAENKKTVFINDMQNDYVKYISNLDSYKGEGKLLLESVICLPLVVEEKLVGLISVQSPKKNTYTQNHLEILQTLASYVAIALDNARLYNNLVKGKEEIERTYKNIQVLSEIGQQLTSTLNFEELFSKLHENVNILMDGEVFGIRIYHPEKNCVTTPYEYEKGERQESITFSMDNDDNLSVWCIKNKRDIFMNDNLNEYKKYVNDIVLLGGEMPHSLMFCPMILKDKVIGVITVQSYKKNSYTKQHLDILRTLANYTAIAFDNALLYDNMEGEVNARTTEIEKQKLVLEDKNLKITDSINYALRIQQAILPSQEMINAILPNSFIFFQPKDIVSGDFYWAHTIPSPNGEANETGEVLFAAVDCTGHGVPGAFMSIMGNNLLDQIVNETKIYQPALILTELSKLVVDSLKQTGEIGSIKEGMDIALCKIDYKNLELEYAGAHNALNLIRNGKLTETKANQRSIGISTNAVQFINHKIKLEKGDCIYIFSDGYADQYGGKNNQKLFYQPFRELLVEIHQLSMEKQKKKLEKVIADWKGEREQTDDMLVIGVRI